ncbi:hypothetical protein BJY04DRAFT_213680 [Aspergillus karnatakaensis]|uniref:uncharacterized protein n=1 Tax=Aspergillus karnatakaensis TaxID=1810916 RepID=UPI003CCCB8C1
MTFKNYFQNYKKVEHPTPEEYNRRLADLTSKCNGTPTKFIPKGAMKPAPSSTSCIFTLKTSAQIDLLTATPAISATLWKNLTAYTQNRRDTSGMKLCVWAGRWQDPYQPAYQGTQINALLDLPMRDVPDSASDAPLSASNVQADYVLFRDFFEGFSIKVEGVGKGKEVKLAGEWNIDCYVQFHEKLQTYRLQWFSELAQYDKADVGPFAFWSNYPRGAEDESKSTPLGKGEAPRGLVYKP